MVTETVPTLPVPPPMEDTHDNCTDTDCLVCMPMTIPQHVDGYGSKLEDLAGIGEYEVLGG